MLTSLPIPNILFETCPRRFVDCTDTAGNGLWISQPEFEFIFSERLTRQYLRRIKGILNVDHLAFLGLDFYVQ